MLLTACTDNAPSFATDYSDVPSLPDTTNALSKSITDDGIIIYVIDEGNPESLELTVRDNVFAYFTTRDAEDDEILQSSFANGVTSARRITNIGSQSAVNFVSRNLIKGLLGMHEGGRRVLIFPNEITTYSRDGDLIIDFELENIIF